VAKTEPSILAAHALGDGVTTGEMGDGGLTLTTEALHNVAASAFEQRSEEEWQQLVLA